MVDVFVAKLRSMDDTDKESLARALQHATDPAIVRSAFDLPPELRTVIQSAVAETFSIPVALRFETAPDLVSGIELSTNGQKVAWSIAGYLDSLESGVEALLPSPTPPGPSSR